MCGGEDRDEWGGLGVGVGVVWLGQRAWCGGEEGVVGGEGKRKTWVIFWLMIK